jgi:hypothetical protein
MSAVNVNLSESVHKYLAALAEKEGVSVEHFVATAVAEKISALTTEDYLQERASRGSRQDLKRILDQVPDREPDPMERSS